MPKINLKYASFSSFDEFFETLLRGNEVEFEFLDKKYFVLPVFCNKKVIAFSFGEANKEQNSVYTTFVELYQAPIEKKLLGEVITDVKIIFRCF